MLNKLRISLLSATALAVVLTGVSILSSPNAYAQTYSAGNERSGTHICSCPVLSGNCVCETAPPPPIDPCGGECGELAQ